MTQEATAFVLAMDSPVEQRFAVADHICPEIFEMLKLSASLLREMREEYMKRANSQDFQAYNSNDFHLVKRVDRFLKGIPNAPRTI